MQNKHMPKRLRKALQQYLVWMHVSRAVRARIIGQIQTWICCNGVHTACRRLKAAGDALRAWVRRRQCKHNVDAPAWVATTRSGFPKLFQGVDYTDFITLEKLSKLYKVFKPDQFKSVGAFPDEVVKRVEAVKTPSNAGQADMDEARELIKLGAWALKPSSHISVDGASVGHIITHKTTSLAEVLGYYAAIAHIVPASVCVDEAFGSDTEPFPVKKILDIGLVDVPTTVTAGRYELDVEDGFKARNYFNFHPVLDALTRPLYRALERIERDCGYSVRYLPLFDKISKCQKWLSEGRTVFSVDQTSATDRFPLALQEYYLKVSGCPEEWIRAIHEISLMEYDVDKNLQEAVGSDKILIACGNPMGACYSMPLYTLALISLILGACIRFDFDPDFQVLGDDVIFTDARLAEWFTSFLPKLGVDISKSKGVASSEVAEFIGATITKDEYTFPGKFKYPTNRNIFQIVKAFGRPLKWGKDEESDLRFQRAIGMALIKEQCYKPLDVRSLGPIPPLACSYDKDTVARIDKIAKQYKCDPALLDEMYLNYTQTRVISTLRSLGGQLATGSAKTIGARTDDLLGRLLWDTEYLNWFSGTEWEKDTHYSISMLCDAMINVVGTAVSRETAAAFKSGAKPSGRTRDEKLGSFLSNAGEWLKEWSGGSRSYDQVAAYFVFEGIGACLNEIYGYLMVDHDTNKWRTQQGRYERFVQFAHASSQ